MRWRILIVEDNSETAEQIKNDALNGRLLPDIGRMEPIVFPKFKEAAARLDSIRFDFIVLDLREDDIEEGDANPGLAVFNKIKESRFVPVIFYTALPQYVKDLETTFVRVVEKTEGITKIRLEIKSIYDTKLPNLVKHLEEEQLKYMWDFVGNHWIDAKTSFEQADVAYLLSRRLSHLLKQSSIRRFLKKDGSAVPDVNDVDKIHAMEMYIHPVPIEEIATGYIIKGLVNNEDSYWMVLTPSCDFEHGHVEQVLLVKCLELTSFEEYMNYEKLRTACEKGKLISLINDKRHKKQSERYKFLPGTFFMPDLVVDFQNLIHIPKDILLKMKAVATLDTPFIEAIITRFARYYGRIGTPDLDIRPVISRIDSTLPASKTTEVII